MSLSLWEVKIDYRCSFVFNSRSKLNKKSSVNLIINKMRTYYGNIRALNKIKKKESQKKYNQQFFYSLFLLKYIEFACL